MAERRRSGRPDRHPGTLRDPGHGRSGQGPSPRHWRPRVNHLASPSAVADHEPSITIRRVQPSDRDALAGFYSGLTPESRRARFLGYGTALAAGTARTFCTPDHMHEEGFVAVLDEGDPLCVVGHICLTDARERAPELAIAVADPFQERGIGRALFEAALAWAHDHNVERLSASAFANNSRILRLLTSAPAGADVRTVGGGVVEITIPMKRPLPRDLAISTAQLSGSPEWRVAPSLRRTGRHAYWLHRPSANSLR
jgi:RimJ/RimL family protein N-acetyltransferase